jgi:predicted GH43/DUF377 family glycosyl hydrolase
MSTRAFQELFTRHPDNPIITVKDLPYPANSVFNAGATTMGDEVILLMRVEDRRGISHLTVARSHNGISDWRIDSKPTMLPRPDTHPEEIYGIEDPRVTFMQGQERWAVVYTSYSESGPLVSLATTEDFRSFRRLGPVMPPENKDAALFPVRFNGRWALIHRPVSTFPGTGAHIWISFSTDLRYWGDHHLLIPARKGAWWDANKVGLSPPPLETERGWLILYHGVKNTPSGCIYRLGLALLDIRDPCRVKARCDEWVFEPQDSYEVCGDVDKVAFPCGWVARDGEIWLYYGAADTCLALATARFSDLLDWLEEHNVHT